MTQSRFTRQSKGLAHLIDSRRDPHRARLYEITNEITVTHMEYRLSPSCFCTML